MKKAKPEVVLTRQQILDAVFDIFTCKDYAKTSLEKVAI
jgi:AcrR family transcriptional regulator